jgi:hypothetical protein
MRTLFFLALIVVGLVIAGVLQIQKTGDSISIHVDKERLHEVEQNAAKTGGELLQKAQTNLQNSGNGQPATR